jgi:hypothetical protein
VAPEADGRALLLSQGIDPRVIDPAGFIDLAFGGDIT